MFGDYSKPQLERKEIYMSDKDTNLIWIDLEMTGLDPQQDQIIEIATIVTDKDLHVLEEGPLAG